VSCCWSFPAGGVTKQECLSHDYNPYIGNVPGIRPFRELYPEAYECFAGALVNYIEHVKEVTQKMATGNAEPKVLRQARTGPELETDRNGYPLLPPLLPPAGSKQEKILQGQKDLIRIFLVMHYRTFRSEESQSCKT
jgi:hypothetical protein